MHRKIPKTKTRKKLPNHRIPSPINTIQGSLQLETKFHKIAKNHTYLRISTTNTQFIPPSHNRNNNPDNFIHQPSRYPYDIISDVIFACAQCGKQLISSAMVTLHIKVITHKWKRTRRRKSFSSNNIFIFPWLHKNVWYLLYDFMVL